jgi:hypothetical protein
MLKSREAFERMGLKEEKNPEDERRSVERQCFFERPQSDRFEVSAHSRPQSDRAAPYTAHPWFNSPCLTWFNSNSKIFPAKSMGKSIEKGGLMFVTL